MIGILSGDIVASPYVNDNRKSISDFFFMPFATNEQVKVRYGKTERDHRAVTVKHEAKPGAMSAAAQATADWLRSEDRDAESLRDFLQGTKMNAFMFPALCAVVGEGHKGDWGADASLNSDVEAVADACGVDMDSRALGRFIATSVAHPGPGSAELAAQSFAKDFPVTTPAVLMSHASVFNYIAGGEKSFLDNGTLVDGSGQPDLKYFYDCAASILSSSGSYRESVQKAVALGGNYGCEFAAFVGGLAEWCWGCEESFAQHTKEYLSAEQENSVSRFEKYGISAGTLDNKEKKAMRRLKEEGRYRVLSYGNNTVYAIAADDEAARKAVSRLRVSKDRSVYICAPEDLDILARELSVARDERGNVLSGLYFEADRPRINDFWLQNGRFVSSTSREFSEEDMKAAENIGHRLPAPLTRQNIWSDWVRFVDYCRDVRNKLEEPFFGADKPEGMHLHFASAIYPDVPATGTPRVVRLMRGDICMAACGIDDEGRVTNMSRLVESGERSEYIQGAFENRNLFAGAFTLQDFKDKIEEHVLDAGVQVREKDPRGEDDEPTAFDILNQDRTKEDIGKYQLGVSVLDNVEQVASGKGINLDIVSVALKNEKDLSKGAPLSESHKGAVFTIGCSNMPLNQFDRLIKTYGFDLVVDVRPYPKSDFAPQFDKEPFYSHLENDLGVGVEYFGDVLGCNTRVKVGKDEYKELSYEDIHRSERFQKNVQNLREAVRDGARMLILDSRGKAEESPRALLIGAELAHPLDGRRKGLEVFHLTRTGTLVPQADIEQPLLRTYHKGEIDYDISRADAKDRFAACFRKGDSLAEDRGKKVELWKGAKAATENKPRKGYRKNFKRSK